MANDTLKLDESGEWVGLWWLPDDPGERLPDTLRYDPEGGVSLSLIGAFECRIMSDCGNGYVSYDGEIKTWEFIHGVAERRAVTLLGVIPTQTKGIPGWDMGSPNKQILTATAAIIGEHVGGEDDKSFSAVKFSVEDLGVWAASSAIDISLGTTDGKINGTGHISVKPVETRSVKIGGSEYKLVCLIRSHTLIGAKARPWGARGALLISASSQISLFR